MYGLNLDNILVKPFIYSQVKELSSYF